MAKTDVELGPVRIVEDLNMRPEDVRELGFRLLTHWSNVPAVSEADAHALVCRRQMLSEQVEARREAQMAEWVARFPVPAGVPAIPGMTAAEQMFAAGEVDRPRSVREQLLDAELAHVKGVR
jgi:hypothetical protein